MFFDCFQVTPMEMVCRFSKLWLAGGDIPAEMDWEIKKFLEDTHG